jgi:hypothetical protein
VAKRCRARETTFDHGIRRMRLACWITKATNTHSEYVIFIVFFFTQQKWWLERASVLRLYLLSVTFVFTRKLPVLFCSLHHPLFHFCIIPNFNPLCATCSARRIRISRRFLHAIFSWRVLVLWDDFV